KRLTENSKGRRTFTPYPEAFHETRTRNPFRGFSNQNHTLFRLIKVFKAIPNLDGIITRAFPEGFFYIYQKPFHEKSAPGLIFIFNCYILQLAEKGKPKRIL